MPRRGNIAKRKPAPDPVYDSILLQKFINKMMRRGKKSKAETIVYKALAEAEKKLNKKAMEIFDQVLSNITPALEVKARRVGGATYQVPVEVSKERGQSMAMAWLCEASQGRGGKSMIANLTAELTEAYNGQGAACQMKGDLHKTAEANKAFAHFRW